MNEPWQDKIAQCESGGNWSINTGNGYYGGLQFDVQLLARRRRRRVRPEAAQATPAQQIATADVLRAAAAGATGPPAPPSSACSEHLSCACAASHQAGSGCRYRARRGGRFAGTMAQVTEAISPDRPDSRARTRARPLLGAADIRRLAEEIGRAAHQDPRARTSSSTATPSGGSWPPPTSGADETVLEVGPGLGSLTLGLLDAAAAVVAVEIDPVLAGAAAGNGRRSGGRTPPGFRPRPGRRHEGDRAARGPPTALVANLPYNVAVPVVLHLLRALPSPAARPGHGPGRGGRPPRRRPRIQDLRRALGQGRLVQQHAQGRRDRHERLLARAQDPLRARGLHPPRAAR